MLHPLHAGLDWTATPSLKEPFPYGPGIVAVEEEGELEVAFEVIRTRFVFNGEIKGHNSSVDVLDAVLEALLLCKAQVGVLLLDKKVLLTQADVSLPPPALLRHQMACTLVEKFIERHALARLLCDDEIRGKREWQEFRTEVLRCNRRLRPSNKPKVAAYPSHQSALVQAADCLAYTFARSLRGALDARVSEKLKVLQGRDENIFQVVQIWER